MAIAASASLPATMPAGISAPAAAHADTSDGIWDFSFRDLVSIVNPLQHFPIVSTLYRKFTGDTIKPLERLAGDTLYGGWIGFVSSAANLVFEKVTGRDVGDTVLAFLGGEDTKSAPASGTAVVVDKPAPAPELQPLPVSLTSLGPLEPAIALSPRAAVHAAIPQQSADAAIVKSLRAAHLPPDLEQRALFAYRRAIQKPETQTQLAPTL